jgi:D-xylose transport system substrate-binding protein
MAESVVDFFGKEGYPTHVIVTGQDLTAKSRLLIKEGKLDMTVHKSVKDLAYNAIDVALDLAKDGRLKKGRDYKYVNNGRKDIPSILLPAETVSVQNIDDFVNAD